MLLRCLVLVVLESRIYLFQFVAKGDDFLIKLDLLPDIRDHDLELSVSVIEKPLVVLDLHVDEVVRLVERPDPADVVEEALALAGNVLLLVVHGVEVELMTVVLQCLDDLLLLLVGDVAVGFFLVLMDVPIL